MAGTCGMRAFVRQLRKSRASDRAVIAARHIESWRGRRLLSEGPAPDHEVRKPAGCNHRAHVPARVRHRHARASDRGAGPVRLRSSLANSQWTSDREPDRSAADDRSGTTGRHADAFGPYSFCLLYRSTFVSLTDFPHGDHQPAARGKHVFRYRLRILWDCTWDSLSSLRRWLSFRQAGVRLA